MLLGSYDLWELWIRPEATGGHWRFFFRGTHFACVGAITGHGNEFNIRRASPI